jgi:hypothetical protein
MIKTRSVVQIRTHAQKYFLKLHRGQRRESMREAPYLAHGLGHEIDNGYEMSFDGHEDPYAGGILQANNLLYLTADHQIYRDLGGSKAHQNGGLKPNKPATRNRKRLLADRADSTSTDGSGSGSGSESGSEKTSKNSDCGDDTIVSPSTNSFYKRKKKTHPSNSLFDKLPESFSETESNERSSTSMAAAVEAAFMNDMPPKRTLSGNMLDSGNFSIDGVEYIDEFIGLEKTLKESESMNDTINNDGMTSSLNSNKKPMVKHSRLISTDDLQSHMSLFPNLQLPSGGTDLEEDVNVGLPLEQYGEEEVDRYDFTKASDTLTLTETATGPVHEGENDVVTEETETAVVEEDLEESGFFDN